MTLVPSGAKIDVMIGTHDPQHAVVAWTTDRDAAELEQAIARVGYGYAPESLALRHRLDASRRGHSTRMVVESAGESLLVGLALAWLRNTGRSPGSVVLRRPLDAADGGTRHMLAA